MKTCRNTIFPILPSIINVKEEIADFIQNKHRINFPEECVFGNALAKVLNTPKTPTLGTRYAESGYGYHSKSG
jgi:acetyltransferase